ncbi:hypothetical protein [Longimicrobium sp.]|uniref:hypothetical protein n=1 Tax=Longimicrobium sp. TaxID=2029185 RepID=UPI002C9A896A|nr:hypothetical protein [Longimicrobium sp.]HSU16011.1 hypothetical protein [Longimicrobium sp.]
MGLFDRHDYGRDYGREHGNGRGLGDRMRGAWQRFESRMGGGMHGRGYDRGMMQGGGWNHGGEGRGYDASDFAYRGLDGAWSTARNRGAHDAQWDWRAAGGARYDQDIARHGGYDRGFRAQPGMQRGGYDRDVHGGRDRMRTDAGDPFGDRQSRTPFRVMRGGFEAGQTDRGGWHDGHQASQPNRGDPYGVRDRGWNRGIGDEPTYRPEDFRGWDHGRGRRG